MEYLLLLWVLAILALTRAATPRAMLYAYGFQALCLFWNAVLFRASDGVESLRVLPWMAVFFVLVCAPLSCCSGFKGHGRKPPAESGRFDLARCPFAPPWRLPCATSSSIGSSPSPWDGIFGLQLGPGGGRPLPAGACPVPVRPPGRRRQSRRGPLDGSPGTRESTPLRDSGPSRCPGVWRPPLGSSRTAPQNMV